MNKTFAKFSFANAFCRSDRLAPVTATPLTCPTRTHGLERKPLFRHCEMSRVQREILHFAVTGVLVTSAPHALAACPASIKGGDINNPMELVDSDISRDPAYANALLKTTTAALRTPQKRCEEGRAEWCKIAEFHAKAKAGLECYAGVSTQNVTNSGQAGTSSTAGQMNSGSATNMGGSSSRSSSGIESASQNPSACKCGPTYIDCLSRGVRASGGNFTIARQGSELRIGIWNSKGESTSAYSWDSNSGKCDGIVK